MMRILSLLILMMALPAQAAVTAILDKNPVLAGETVTLTISSDSGGDEPDLSPLEQNFQILGSSSSSQFQLINGRSSRSHDWIIQLRPKQLGTITIPALQVGQQSTQPIALEIKKPQVQAGQWPEAFVEFSADKQEAWLREQVLLNVKLFVRGDLVSGNFTEPQSSGAVIEKLGDSQESQALRGNYRYRVIERHYALFAEQSGTLQIAAPVFNGEIATQSQQPRNVFGFGRRATRAIYAAGDAIDLTIKAPPQNLAGPDWLPASQVTLEESLQPDVSRLKAGEPLTRIIKLSVQGQLHTQLPALDIQTPVGSQAYTEPPQDETRANASGLIATRSYSTAIIAGSGDSMQLPALEISWWDTRNERLQTARIPARQIALESVAASVPTAPPSAVATPAIVSPPMTDNVTASAPSSLWLWQIAAIACAGGWLGTLLAWFWLTRRAPASKNQKTTDGSALKPLRKTLQQADAAQCRCALLAWARQSSGKTQTLSSLARQTQDDAQIQALHQLDAAAFGHADTFDRTALLNFVEDYNRPTSSPTPSPLASLYPE